MSANPVNSERVFAEAALEHWRRLGEELRANNDQFNRERGSASISEPARNEYRVGNTGSGLEVRIVTDPVMETGKKRSGIHSSDQPLTGREARSLLRDPVLNPPNA